MPVPLSETAISNVFADADLRVRLGVVGVEPRARNLDFQLAAARHRITGVDGEIEQYVVQLAAVDYGHPRFWRDINPKVDIFTERPRRSAEKLVSRAPTSVDSGY